MKAAASEQRLELLSRRLVVRLGPEIDALKAARGDFARRLAAFLLDPRLADVKREAHRLGIGRTPERAEVHAVRTKMKAARTALVLRLSDFGAGVAVLASMRVAFASIGATSPALERAYSEALESFAEAKEALDRTRRQRGWSRTEEIDRSRGMMGLRRFER